MGNLPEIKRILSYLSYLKAPPPPGSRRVNIGVLRRGAKGALAPPPPLKLVKV